MGDASGHLRLTASRRAHSDHLIAQLAVDGLSATTRVIGHYAHAWNDLVAFFDAIEKDWRGWSGAREWSSLEHDLAVTARHRGHVELRVTLRETGMVDGWRASATIDLEPGEQLSRVAGDVRRLGRPS